MSHMYLFCLFKTFHFKFIDAQHTFCKNLRALRSIEIVFLLQDNVTIPIKNMKKCVFEFSDQFQHKLGCTITEYGQKLEIDSRIEGLLKLCTDKQTNTMIRYAFTLHLIFFYFSFTSLSILFHLYQDEPISRLCEIGRNLGKTT